MKILFVLTLFILNFMGTVGAESSNAYDRLNVRVTSGDMTSEASTRLFDKVHFLFKEIDAYWGGAQGSGLR